MTKAYNNRLDQMCTKKPEIPVIQKYAKFGPLRRFTPSKHLKFIGNSNIGYRNRVISPFRLYKKF